MNDCEICKEEADSFYNGAKKLIGTDAIKQLDNFAVYEYPYIVNLAFACELYLKYLNYSIGKMVKGHSLKDLFDSLDDKLKNEFSEKGFNNNILLDMDNSFVDWRYVYEKEQVFCNVSGLEQFAELLKEICDKN